jgi:hypothetical protein
VGVADVIPTWHKRERHRISTTLPPEALLDAVETLTWGEVRIFRMLMSARFRYGDRFPAREPVLGWFHDSGFVLMSRTPTELTLASVQATRGDGDPVLLTTSRDVRAFSEPGHLKLALEFRIEPGRLVTETRVEATDAATRRLFAIYWAAIRAFSGLIRREWLRAVRRHALARVQAT